jgi:UDP-N-acetylmuramoylalanine--D-glutamate ligase
MEDVCAPFNSKYITILGLGLLGRGVGDAEFLAGCGAHVIVTDKKNENELAESVARLKKFPNIEFHLGGHQAEDFEKADLVIKAAGVSLDSPEIEIARKNNIEVAMSTALFAKYAMETGAKVVGVTGTRGKSTVAQMIYEVLKAAGKNVLLGGNVRGVSTLAMLPEVSKDTIAVLELDSWQLQGFGDLKISPHIAVFTNLMPDHLNYYSGDMEKYFSDKANIFRFQKESDFLFMGKECSKLILETYVGKLRAQLHVVHSANFSSEWDLRIPGEHNRLNAAFAFRALRALDIPDEEIKNGLESFEGVEGRLQFVRELNGVKIYNDNNSTTPEASIAALDALGKNITLIIGGSEKDLPLEKLISSIKENVSHVILLTHENYKGSKRLANELRTANIPFVEVATLQQAVDVALQLKERTILFSPAFASFGMFKNEYERNDQFLALVKTLPDTQHT